MQKTATRTLAHKAQAVPRSAASPAQTPGFWHFLRQPAQRRDLVGMLSLCLLLYAVLHYCYPYPMLTPDSANYVYCALLDLYGGYRPMGYSWFLQAVHAFSLDVGFVGTVQFWLQAAASTVFLFAIKYCFPPRRPVFFYALALLLLLSPGILLLTHWLMSDSLFLSLTLLWLSSGLGLLRRMRWGLVLLHVLVLVAAIQVRFIGFFYPAFTAAGLLLAHGWRLRPLVVAGFSLFCAYVVYHNVRRETYEWYGTDIFSGFSGWAAANNAVAMLPHVRLAPDELAAEPELAQIHQRLSAVPDTAYSPRQIINTSFMWSKTFPGKAVLLQERLANPQFTYTGAWIHTGQLFERYAAFLVRHYPVAYARYFLLLNLKQVFWPQVTLDEHYKPAPPTGEMQQYYALDGVSQLAARHEPFGWYGPTGQRAACLGLWLAVLLALPTLCWRRRVLALSREQRRGLTWLLSFGVVYLGLSLVAHPVQLRYLLPVHAVQVLVLYLALQSLLPPPPARAAGE